MCGVQRLVTRQRGIVQKRCQQSQSGLWTVGESDGDGAVELDHRGGSELGERPVEVGDLRPVRTGLDLERGDRRLQLVLTGLPQAHGTLERPKALADARLVPQRAVLLLDREVAAALVHARGAPRVVQQHQREQSPHLPVVGHQLAQQEAEADCLVAQLLAHEAIAFRGGVTLVEDQIDDAQDPAHAVRQLLVSRHLIGNPGVGDLALGPHDPLAHRRLGHQECARDLAGGESP